MTVKKQYISIAVILLIIALFALYLRNNYRTILHLLSESITLAKGPSIFLLTLLSMVSILLNGLLLDTMVSGFGFKLRFRESFGLSMVTRFYNYITPLHGGMAVRAVYLKKVRNFPYSYFLTALSGVYVIIIFFASLAGIISSIIIWFSYKTNNISIFLFFIAVLTGNLFIILFLPKLPESNKKIVGLFIKVVNGWHVIKKRQIILHRIALLSCAQLVNLAFQYKILYSIYDIEIDIIKCLYIASIGTLSFVISVTPGNLGISEAVSVYSASVVGINIDASVAASILLRATNIIVVFIFGPIFSYVLFPKKWKRPERPCNC
jgi:uncharacterized membrane protein YbhN (UPF0104 family)